MYKLSGKTETGDVPTIFNGYRHDPQEVPNSQRKYRRVFSENTLFTITSTKLLRLISLLLLYVCINSHVGSLLLTASRRLFVSWCSTCICSDAAAVSFLVRFCFLPLWLLYTAHVTEYGFLGKITGYNRGLILEWKGIMTRSFSPKKRWASY